MGRHRAAQVRAHRVCAALYALLCAWPALAAQRADLTPLLDAARSGNHSAALALVREGADVRAAEADGTTALHWAANFGDAELARALLAAGADSAAANRYGMTPLQVAAVNANAELLDALIAAGADPNAVLPEGETVLMTAARTGSPEALKVLLAHGANVEARESFYGESALIWAAAENHADAIRVLVEHGADVNGRSALMQMEKRRLGQSILPLGSWTPLMYAARQNALEAGEALAAAHADLNAADPDGATALVIAIINAHYEFADFLLGKGADPNVVDNEAGMGPLYAAVDMHRLAVGHGRGNPTPVGLLTSVDIARSLLEHGADANARLKKPIMQRQHTFGDSALGAGATPLMRAAKSGDIEMLRVLLAGGADPEATLPNGTTALMFAAGLGWRNGSPLAPSYDQGSDEEAVQTIELLLELGLDVNAATDTGDTALHAAVSGRKSETIVKYLLERGADPRKPNGKQQTPLALAESPRGAPALAALLRAAPGAAE
ncbi:MAG TPA: ankyrin repeat domain-containing protein [Gammaproteobacteria bacterium]|nr:ankyrin repeat domain-containing protein [Gammaproteobacteria bacterium]